MPCNTLATPHPLGRLSLDDRRPTHPGDRSALTGEIARGAGAPVYAHWQRKEWNKAHSMMLRVCPHGLLPWVEKSGYVWPAASAPSAHPLLSQSRHATGMGSSCRLGLQVTMLKSSNVLMRFLCAFVLLWHALFLQGKTMLPSG